MKHKATGTVLKESAKKKTHCEHSSSFHCPICARATCPPTCSNAFGCWRMSTRLGFILYMSKLEHQMNVKTKRLFCESKVDSEIGLLSRPFDIHFRLPLFTHVHMIVCFQHFVGHQGRVPYFVGVFNRHAFGPNEAGWSGLFP